MALREIVAARSPSLLRSVRRVRDVYFALRYPRGIPMRINGEQLRIRRDCRWVGHYAATGERVHEPELWAALVDELRESDVVVDVGANVGVHAVACARRLRDGRVYAFEPDPRNAEALRSHAKLNDVADRLDVTEAAVGAAEGTTAFAAAGSLMSSVDNLWDAPGDHELRDVRVVTLDAALADGADIVKIDVEGYEIAVLQGARELLNDARRRPRLILVELHEPLLAKLGSSPAEALDILRDAGYDVSPVAEYDVAELAPWSAAASIQQWAARYRVPSAASHVAGTPRRR